MSNTDAAVGLRAETKVLMSTQVLVGMMHDMQTVAW